MSAETGNTQRRYRKRRRAEHERRTRERITEATVRLHGSVGPARTTVSAVAKEAGVQRATVYRHFPDEKALFEACTAHYWAANPMPDPASWRKLPDPGERLRRGLTEMYEFFARTEGMLEKTGRDAALVEAMAKPAERFLVYLASAADALVAGRRVRGAARRRVRAAAGHAVSFPTWQSLVRRQGLSNDEAAGLMAALIEAAGSAEAASPRARRR